MEITNLIPHIEALIFASDKPLTSLDLTELLNNAFGFMEDKITLDQVEASLEGIQEKYQSEFYPFEVRQSGGGWQFLTKRDYHKTIAQLNGDKFLKRLSAAAMETLSIVAYKQPVTKGEIESIRGVSSDYAVQKLLEKELIVITGRNETMPGHPLIYSTSKNFMDYFGINNAEDLPKIKEVLADQQIEPTVMKDMVPEEDPIVPVNEDGTAVKEVISEDEVDTEAGLTESGGEAAVDEAVEAFIDTEDGTGDTDESEEADLDESVEIVIDEQEITDESLEETGDENISGDDYPESTDDFTDETTATEGITAGETPDPAGDALTEDETTEDSVDTNEETPDDGLLSVTEDGQLIGKMEDDDDDQS
ncbi:MAG: SMC-Scp complex subunit ScpB [Chitinophagaceae bacterium]